MTVPDSFAELTLPETDANAALAVSGLLAVALGFCDEPEPLLDVPLLHAVSPVRRVAASAAAPRVLFMRAIMDVRHVTGGRCGAIVTDCSGRTNASSADAGE
ncbi:hypothetical protein GCM10022403_023490 [Streptomyces coacervatus]|uniref:Uncharacterized protein n=1 Tax=Streptomyces coacervatus TaxID=647381 RepID=A0ABP7HG82_9ACTN